MTKDQDYNMDRKAGIQLVSGSGTLWTLVTLNESIESCVQEVPLAELTELRPPCPYCNPDLLLSSNRYSSVLLNDVLGALILNGF